MNRSLHLSPGLEEAETLYTISVDSPDGPALLGLVVTGTSVEVLTWVDEDAVSLATLELPQSDLDPGPTSVRPTGKI
jgi:hypothetical protein